MADDLASPQGATTVASPATATPSPTTPAPTDAVGSQAPAQDAPSSPSPATAPAQDAAPVTPPVEAAPAAAPTGDSLLGGEPTAKDAPPVTPEVKAPEAKTDTPPVEPKKEEAAQSAEPAPLPTYESFALPENVKFEDAKLGEFTKMLGEFETGTKADHAAVQKFGQDLVNRHVAEVQNVVKGLNDYYANAFEKQKSEWKDALMKDPELGGNRLNTVAKEIADTLASTSSKEEHEAFRTYMSQSGIANNLAVGRPIYNLVKEITRLRTMYESESGTRPLAGAKPASQPISKLEKRYGKRS